MSKLIFCTCKTITTKYRKLCIPVFLLPFASSALKQLEQTVLLQPTKKFQQLDII